MEYNIKECKCKIHFIGISIGSYLFSIYSNPGANTIELHLQQALFKAGAIDPRNMERLQKISWMRCARTDKGVHAVGQIVSAKVSCFIFLYILYIHSLFIYSS